MNTAMLDLLKNTYSKVESLKGKGLIRLLSIIFLVFIVVGGLIGYITSLGLKGSEVPVNPNLNVQTSAQVTYQGVVTYLGEDAYPEDKIYYSLADAEGDHIIFLKTDDEKLDIFKEQAFFVTVMGKKGTTLDGQNEVLQVSEVTFNNN